MATAAEYEQVPSVDGDAFDAYRAEPPGGSGPGVVLLQEIFGINDNMRGVADRLAGEGYVVLVPDMFWRLERRFERKDEAGFGDALAMVQRFDLETGASDLAATVDHVRGMPGCTGTVGAAGFCLGGTLALLAATRAGVDAAVSYYGSGNNDLLGEVRATTCPLLFHYGDQDPFIPEEKVAEVEGAVAGRPDTAVHRYAAGHAFSNWDAPSMFDEAAAEAAWDRTLEFLARHLQR